MGNSDFGLLVETPEGEGSKRVHEGLWHLPEDPESAIRGTLTVTDSQILLTLVGGGFDWPPDDLSPPTYPVIWGICDDGSRVSLMEAHLGRTEFRDGTSEETGLPTRRIQAQHFYAYDALIGHSLFDPETHQVKDVIFRTTLLPTWLGPLKFDVPRDNPDFAIKLETPEKLQVRLDGADMLVGWGEGRLHLGEHRCALSVEPFVRVSVDNPVGLDELWDHWITPLVLFLMLCHGDSDRLEQVQVITTGVERLSTGIEYPAALQWHRIAWRRTEAPSDARHRLLHLLPYDLYKTSLQALVPAWLSVYSRTKYPLLRHFSRQFSDQRLFAELDFASRVGTLEAFHRDLYGGTYEEPQDFSGIIKEVRSRFKGRTIDNGQQDLGTFLQDRLRRANELSLKRRLDALLADAGDVLQRDSRRKQGRHSAIVSTRDAITHTQSIGVHLNLQELVEELPYLQELMQASMLRALELPPSEVDQALMRHRGRAHQWPPPIESPPPTPPDT